MMSRCRPAPRSAPGIARFVSREGARPLIGPSSTRGASIRSTRKAGQEGQACATASYGALATKRWPRCARPWRRVMFVFTQVSSMKTSRPGASHVRPVLLALRAGFFLNVMPCAFRKCQTDVVADHRCRAPPAPPAAPATSGPAISASRDRTQPMISRARANGRRPPIVQRRRTARRPITLRPLARRSITETPKLDATSR